MAAPAKFSPDIIRNNLKNPKMGVFRYNKIRTR
jgi:hypothetical protein